MSVFRVRAQTASPTEIFVPVFRAFKRVKKNYFFIHNGILRRKQTKTLSRRFIARKQSKYSFSRLENNVNIVNMRSIPMECLAGLYDNNKKINKKTQPNDYRYGCCTAVYWYE